MTMKRNAKLEATQEVLQIFDGTIAIRTETPGERKAYGNTLPARVAAPMLLRGRRFSASKPQSRERHVAMWPERQLARGNGYGRKVVKR